MSRFASPDTCSCFSCGVRRGSCGWNRMRRTCVLIMLCGFFSAADHSRSLSKLRRPISLRSMSRFASTSRASATTLSSASRRQPSANTLMRASVVSATSAPARSARARSAPPGSRSESAKTSSMRPARAAHDDQRPMGNMSRISTSGARWSSIRIAVVPRSTLQVWALAAESRAAADGAAPASAASAASASHRADRAIIASPAAAASRRAAA